MEICRILGTVGWITVMVIVFSTTASASEKDSEPAQSDRHENLPRIFGFFSRSKPEAEKESGVGLKQHIGNVLQGGTFGFEAEFRPLEKVHGVIEHAKKFVPGLFGGKESDEDLATVTPEKKPKEHGNVESEDTFGWMPQDPKKEKPEGPKWEDIGEEDDDEVPPKGYVTEPIEDIIHPRKRPKRYIEAKVYHVPLEFMSNAKPVGVKVNENSP